MNFKVQTGNQIFEELLSALGTEGYDQISQRLHVLLHEVAWTTSSELMGELGLEILIFQRSPQSLSPELQELLCRCMDVVKQVWPDIEKVHRTREQQEGPRVA
jgi:hypothetical protein